MSRVREISDEGKALTKKAEIKLRQIIKDTEVSERYMIKVLNLLPVGIEVLFAQEWDLNTCFWLTDALEIEFTSLFV